MWQRLETSDAPRLTLTFEGRQIEARQGDSIAAALLAAGIEDFRTTPRRGSPRGPLCLMGACFDCLVIVDGMPNRQACLVPAADGMEIARQDGMGSPLAQAAE
ncbi:MAG: (2Fe-2S)-binding protein [Pseudomonadota bacterium]